jgi:hypothetical protein
MGRSQFPGERQCYAIVISQPVQMYELDNTQLIQQKDPKTQFHP